MNENQISYAIRGAAFRVFNELGPGLLESVYESALKWDLTESGFIVRSQECIRLKYKNRTIDVGFRLDLIVNDLVIIEIKSLESLSDIHHKQLLTYLKLSGKKLGLLINFNTISIEKSIIRIVNNLDSL